MPQQISDIMHLSSSSLSVHTLLINGEKLLDQKLYLFISGGNTWICFTDHD